MSILQQAQQKNNGIIRYLYEDPVQFTLDAYNVDAVNSTYVSTIFDINTPICGTVKDIQLEYNELTPVILEGQELLMKKSIIAPYMTSSISPSGNFNNLDVYAEEMTLCGYQHYNDLSYIQSDKFTNGMLIGYILDNIFTKGGNIMNTYLKQYLGFICNEYERDPAIDSKTVGYTLYENVEYGNINEFIQTTQLNLDDIIGMVKQTVTTLDYLQTELQFVNGDCRRSTVLVSSEPCLYKYKQMVVDDPFTCKISSFDYSSLAIKLTKEQVPYRLYNPSLQSQKQLWWNPIVPSINIQNNTPYTLMYNETVSQIYSNIRHTGVPVYLSYDTYTFIMSLLSHPSIYPIFSSSKELQQEIWEPLWFNDDIQTANVQLSQLANSNMGDDYSNITKALINLKLKCNVNSHLIH